MTMKDRRCIALVLAVWTVHVHGQTGSSPQFEKDVLPLLTARCVKCHGASKPKAQLDMRTRAGLLKGGESGPALIPGASAKSLLLELVRKGEMPPGKEEKLKSEQVAVLKAWIDAGAPAAQADSTMEVVD